jgi:hypothetical protein
MMQKRRSKRVGLKKMGPLPKKKSKKVHCKFCHVLVPLERARRHDGGWVGPECCSVPSGQTLLR